VAENVGNYAIPREERDFNRSLKIRLKSENILKKSIDTGKSLIHNEHSVSDDLKNPRSLKTDRLALSHRFTRDRGRERKRRR
jgi:hypothetical protein